MEKGAELFCNGFGNTCFRVYQRNNKRLLLYIIAVFVEKSAFCDDKRERNMIILAYVLHHLNVQLREMYLLFGSGIVQPNINLSLCHVCCYWKKRPI